MSSNGSQLAALLSVAAAMFVIVVGLNRLPHLARRRNAATPTPRWRRSGVLAPAGIVAATVLLVTGLLFDMLDLLGRVGPALSMLGSTRITVAAAAGLVLGVCVILRPDWKATRAPLWLRRSLVPAIALVAVLSLVLFAIGTATHDPAARAVLDVQPAEQATEPVPAPEDTRSEEPEADQSGERAPDADGWDELRLPGDVVVQLSTRPCVRLSGYDAGLPVDAHVALRGGDGQLDAGLESSNYPASGEHLAPCEDPDAMGEITTDADRLEPGTWGPCSLAGEPVRLLAGDKVGFVASGSVVGPDGARQLVSLVFSPAHGDVVVSDEILVRCGDCRR